MDLKSINEIPTEVTTLDDNECNQDQIILDHQAKFNLQYENQNCKTKSMELEYDSMANQSNIFGDSNCYETIENISIHNKNMLHNDLHSQETSDDNRNINNNPDDLRQFDVLDDLDRHPEQNDDSIGDSDTDESMDSDVPDEEIEAMLEEGIS